MSRVPNRPGDLWFQV